MATRKRRKSGKPEEFPETGGELVEYYPAREGEHNEVRIESYATVKPIAERRAVLAGIGSVMC